MGVMNLSREFVAQLRGAKELTVLQDDSGNPLGIYRPLSSNGKETTPQKDYTTREVFELFLSLTADDETRAHVLRIIEKVKERDSAMYSFA